MGGRRRKGLGCGGKRGARVRLRRPCPAPSVSPQWFQRPQAAAERMPGAPPPAPSPARGAGCGTRSGGGPAGPGGGARRPAPRTAPPPQCAAAAAGAALTPSAPRPSGRRAAAEPPLGRGRPRARSWINSFPPGTQKGRWAPQCTAAEAARRRHRFNPLPPDGSKAEQAMKSLQGKER